MVTYRTSMQIVADLLTVTQLSGQEGIKTTSLLTKANLSHSRLSKFLNNLSAPDQSILEAIKIIRPLEGFVLSITPFNFSSIAESFGLEL